MPRATVGPTSPNQQSPWSGSAWGGQPSLTHAPCGRRYGAAKGGVWFALNLLEELDAAGECVPARDIVPTAWSGKGDTAAGNVRTRRHERVASALMPHTRVVSYQDPHLVFALHALLFNRPPTRAAPPISARLTAARPRGRRYVLDQRSAKLFFWPPPLPPSTPEPPSPAAAAAGRQPPRGSFDPAAAMLSNATNALSLGNGTANVSFHGFAFR